MIPFKQILSPLPEIESLRVKTAIAVTESIFQQNRDRGLRFEMYWSPSERLAYVRHFEMRRVQFSLPDDALMIGTYNNESGLIQFKDDLFATLNEGGL